MGDEMWDAAMLAEYYGVAGPPALPGADMVDPLEEDLAAQWGADTAAQWTSWADSEAEEDPVLSIAQVGHAGARVASLAADGRWEVWEASSADVTARQTPRNDEAASGLTTPICGGVQGDAVAEISPSGAWSYTTWQQVSGGVLEEDDF